MKAGRNPKVSKQACSETSAATAAATAAAVTAVAAAVVFVNPYPLSPSGCCGQIQRDVCV